MENRPSNRRKKCEVKRQGAASQPKFTILASQPNSPKTVRLVYQIFRKELCPLIRAYADAIDAFVELVEREFSISPTAPCWVTKFDNPMAREAWKLVSVLRVEVANLLLDTVESDGFIYPVPHAWVKIKRVQRPKTVPGTWPPQLATHSAELLGWLTPNERRLSGLLRNTGAVGLEERGAVESQRRGLRARVNEEGEYVVDECASLANSDELIADYYPMLVRPDLCHEAMGVSNATLETLRRKAVNLREWKPKLEKRRSLDPNWRVLIHTYARVRVKGNVRHAADDASQANSGDATPTHPTTRDLASQAGISDDTFRRVRQAAGIEVKLRGAAARNRRYSPSEVERLITAALAGNFIERTAMAEKWSRWGSKNTASKPQPRK